MDGLMFDTEALNADGWKAAGKLHGFEITDDLLQKHIGFNVETTRRLMQDHFGAGFDFDAVRADRIAYSHRYIEEKGMPLKPGLRELLAYLIKSGIKTALGSSSDERIVRFYLERAALNHKFDVIVCGDKVKRGKPEPDIFLRALEELGVSSDDCLVLEDSYNGITAAYRAGIRSVMIPDLLPPTPECEKLFFRKAESLTEVIAIVESLNTLNTLDTPSLAERHNASLDAVPADVQEVLLLFDEVYPCWTKTMARLAAKEPDALDILADKGFLAKEEEVYFLTLQGEKNFRNLAAESFIPSLPGKPGADKKREANRSLLQMLLDKRHMQRWGLKEFSKPFRFRVPDLMEEELFTLEGRVLNWKYQENTIFVEMAKDFPITGMAARDVAPPTPERLTFWTEKNIPKRRVMEADLLYKSRYDFQAYSSFPKLPCDPCGLLNTDRFMCFFAPPPTPGSERAFVTILGEFHMFLTMMRHMYLPGYVDLDSLDQDAVNWLIFVYESEADAEACAKFLAALDASGQNLAGPAEPMDVWSLSLEALLKRDDVVESIHDLLPEVAHPICR
jgi:HAD superfamily hydrolase (TIGR01509 family)